MKLFRCVIRYFSPAELLLWSGSTLMILAAFFLFDGENYLTLAASLIGAASLIFTAKGNPAGQGLMVVFSLLYGAISYTFSYYGEMFTYLGMTMPMAAASLVSWLNNPYGGSRTQVKVDSIRRRELPAMCALTLGVTAAFYFILRYFDTANLLPSTLSVTTSFLAVYLTFRRSPFYALAYAANDVILILLWVLACREDGRYVSVVVCFAAFLVNDLYGFFSWRKMARRQRAAV